METSCKIFIFYWINNFTVCKSRRSKLNTKGLTRLSRQPQERKRYLLNTMVLCPVRVTLSQKFFVDFRANYFIKRILLFVISNCLN